jgi:hypothetical protein
MAAAAVAGTTPTAAYSLNVKAGLKRRIILQNQDKILSSKVSCISHNM